MVQAVVAALLSAALFAVTTNLQRHSAARVPLSDGGPFRLMVRLLRSPIWLIGGLIGVLALALHAYALVHAGVVAVQSLMAMGLLMALAIESVRERRLLPPAGWLGALLVVAGVTSIVLIGKPHDDDSPTVGQGLATAALVTAAALVALTAARSADHHSRGAARVMAACGGACFALDAVFLRAAAIEVGSGRLSWVGVGHTVGFLAASAIGTVVVQRAYQIAALRVVQPSLAAAEPVAAVFVGLTVLAEGVKGGPWGYLALIGGLVAVTVGILIGTGAQIDSGLEALARSATPEDERPGIEELAPRSGAAADRPRGITPRDVTARNRFPSDDRWQLTLVDPARRVDPPRAQLSQER